MTCARHLVRPARPEDLDELLALEQRFPGDRLSRRGFRYHMRNPQALLLVREDAGRVVGYAHLLRRAGSRWWRLYSIVRAADAPRGTGRHLLEASIAAARAGGARGLRLEVREDNTTAIQLYHAFGFVLFATRSDYYEDGARALRMALAFDG